MLKPTKNHRPQSKTTCNQLIRNQPSYLQQNTWSPKEVCVPCSMDTHLQWKHWLITLSHSTSAFSDTCTIKAFRHPHMQILTHTWNSAYTWHSDNCTISIEAMHLNRNYRFVITFDVCVVWNYSTYFAIHFTTQQLSYSIFEYVYRLSSPL